MGATTCKFLGNTNTLYDSVTDVNSCLVDVLYITGAGVDFSTIIICQNIMANVSTYTTRFSKQKQ